MANTLSEMVQYITKQEDFQILASITISHLFKLCRNRDNLYISARSPLLCMLLGVDMTIVFICL